MPDAKQILVIGFGSTLRGDDALGRVACQRLRTVVDPLRVKIIDQAAPTPELAADVAAASLVIFLDASVKGPAGRPVIQRLHQARHLNAMGHAFDLRAVVDLADRLYGRRPQTYLISCRGQTFDLSDNRLSNEAKAACNLIVQHTLELMGPATRRRDPDTLLMQAD